MTKYMAKLAASEGVEVASRALACVSPGEVSPDVMNRIETTANERGYACQRLPSGAGHDAQMFAPNCPTGMIFVPSQGGISHNVKEFTAAAEIDAGLDVLTQVVLQLTE